MSPRLYFIIFEKVVKNIFILLKGLKSIKFKEFLGVLVTGSMMEN